MSISIIQERRIGKDSFQSNRDNHQENRNAGKVADKHLVGENSDTSECDSGRIHHQPTRWR